MKFYVYYVYSTEKNFICQQSIKGASLLFYAEIYIRRKKNMAERKQAQDSFLRTYKLSSFKAFNPKFKEECLSGAEMMLFLEIVRERLIYIRIDEKAWNGNTIKIDSLYVNIIIM